MTKTASKVNKLRVIDAQIIRHIVDRGLMLEKRAKLVEELKGTPELATYQAEIGEWLETVKVVS